MLPGLPRRNRARRTRARLLRPLRPPAPQSMASLDDRSSGLRAEVRHAAPECREGVPGLRRPGGHHPHRAQPGSQGTQGPGPAPQARRLPHPAPDTGDHGRAHRHDRQVPPQPDAAHLALRHRGARVGDHRTDPAGPAPGRARARDPHRQEEQDPRGAADRQDDRTPARLSHRVPPRRSTPARDDGRCSTACTTGSPPGCQRTRSPPCSARPRNLRVRTVHPFPAASTATCCRKTKAMDLYQQGIPLPVTCACRDSRHASTTSAFTCAILA